MKRLLRFTKGSWLFLTLAPLLMMFEVFCDLWQPTLMARIIDIGVANDDVAYILRTGGYMFLATILSLASGFGCLYFSAHATAATGTRLRQALFDHIQSLSFAQLDDLKTASLITRLTNDVHQIQHLLLNAQRILIRAPFLCVGGLFMAMKLSLPLSWVFVASLPILLLAIIIIVAKTIPVSATLQEKIDDLNRIVRENLLGIKVIKSFVTQDKELDKFAISNKQLTFWNIRVQYLMMVLTPFVTFVTNVTIIAVLWFGGHMVMAGQLEIGKIMAFITYILQILQSFTMSFMVMMNFSRAKASADRINDIFETAPTITSPLEALSSPSWALSFDHVYFRYHAGHPWVLEDITFQALPGQTIGIIGATGCGKSTLVSLIPRLYDVSQGTITVGGVDIRQWDLGQLRQQIGMVLQEPLLFSGTFASNLRFGKAQATESQMIQALDQALLKDFLNEQSAGLLATVNQRGSNLSGGQKQRLSIARTLIRQPNILILDDATSALDLKTESLVQKNIKAINQQGLTIIIGQRMSSMLHADLILVLDQGKIIAQGTHQQLLGQCAIYQDIAQTQLGEAVLHHV